MNNQHIFKKVLNEIFIIKCLNTGGEFSTQLWKNEKIKKNTCPCCSESILK